MKIKYTAFIYSLFLISSFFLSTNISKANLYWNQAASFAGTNNSYLAAGDDADLDITGSFSLEALVNPTNSTSPAFQIIFQKKPVSNSGYSLYLYDGRVAVRTLRSTRLVGNILIPSNQWTHIAATYNAGSNLFSVFVNGVLDSSATVTLAPPTANNDSLLIGKGSNDPFAGMMDKIRIWNIDNFVNIYKYHKTSLFVSSGKYVGLVYSLTFQDDDNSGPPFSMTDFTLKNNDTKNNGMSGVELRRR